MSVVLLVIVAPQRTAGAAAAAVPEPSETPSGHEHEHLRASNPHHRSSGRPVRMRQASGSPLPTGYPLAPTRATRYRRPLGARLPHPRPARGARAFRGDQARRPAPAIGARDPAARRQPGRVDRPARGRSLRRARARHGCHAGAPADLRAARVARSGALPGRRWLADRDAPAGVPHARAADALDLQLFERRADEAASALATGNAESAAGIYREALTLWRGTPLADLAFEPFARAVVERLSELRLAAVERCLDAELELGRGAQLVPELEGLVSEHPLNEGLRGQLMIALYRAGRQTEALEVFRARPHRPRRGVRSRADAGAQGARVPRPPAGSHAGRAEQRARRPRARGGRTVLVAARDTPRWPASWGSDGASPRSAGTSC